MRRACIIFPVLLLGAACAPPRASVDYTLSKGIIWPGPPEKPRIQYLWALHRVSPEGLPMETVEPRDSDVLITPQGVFVDGSERLYIADPDAGRVNVIDLKTSESAYIYQAGSEELVSPVSVFAAPDGTVYVTDADLRKVMAFDGKGVLRFALEGPFERPTGLAIDPSRKLVYVVDTWGHKVYVHDYSGKRVSSFGRRGEADEELNFPTHAAVDGEGNIYVSDSGNFKVKIFSPDGSLKKAFGQPGDSFRDFDKIKGIALDTEGHIYVVDSAQNMVKIFDREGRLLLFFGEHGAFYGQFSLPTGIYIDGKNRIFVSDSLNARVQAFQFLGGD
jgi:sugar lactone lactonase YvrE